MKRWVFIITAFLLIIAAGCSYEIPLGQVNEADVLTSQPEQADSTGAESKRVTFEPWEKYQQLLPGVCFDMPNPSTYEEALMHTSACVIGVVKDIEVTKLCTFMATNTDEPLYDTIVKYTVEVKQSVTGDITAGQTIYVLQREWKFGEINIYHEYYPPLDYDKKYLMLLTASEENDNEFYFGSPFVSYPEIIDGKLHPVKHCLLYYEGQPATEAIEEIHAAVLSMEPVYIPIEVGMQTLSEYLTAYDTDFLPVRDLTSEELAEFYDFDGSGFVKYALGKELQNGYRFIWIETAKLDKFLMEQFLEDLSLTVKQMAEEEGIHGKVSVKPYATLITLIGANEDNASVHSKFYDMLTREE